MTADLVSEIQRLSWRVSEMTARITKKADKVKVTRADMEILVSHWASLYERNVGMGPALGNVRTWKGARDLLASMSMDEAKAAVSKAWEDKFFSSKLKELHHVASNINAYRVQLRPEMKPVDKFVAPWQDTSAKPAEAAEALDDLNRKLNFD